MGKSLMVRQQNRFAVLSLWITVPTKPLFDVEIYKRHKKRQEKLLDDRSLLLVSAFDNG